MDWTHAAMMVIGIFEGLLIAGLIFGTLTLVRKGWKR